MTRPNPIAIVALCIIALAVLAFTINEEFGKKKSSVSTATGIVTKNTNVISPIVATNPPHGQPGHRHDLPDGAPLPNGTTNVTTASNSASSSNNILPASSNTVNASSVAINPEHGKPGHICGLPVGAPLDSATIAKAAKEATKTPANATSAGLNPAHGQPGHRCDIAVGAPLNSIPSKVPTNTPSTNTATITTNTNKTTVAAGLNPAHGQPGHRCDIAVGAPLNSPAKAAASTSTTATNNNSLNPSVFPNYNFPKKDSATLPAPVSSAPKFKYDSTGAALNPPHGQPGHDCTIKVGQPLKK